MGAPVWVFDTKMEPVGMIGDAQSVIFARSFRDVGDFEVHIAASRPHAALLTPGNLIRVGNRADMAGVIERVKVDEQRGPTTLSAYGVQLKGVLARRRIVPPTKAEDAGAYGWERASGTGEEVLRHYVSRSAASPRDPNRRIPQLELEPAHAPPLGQQTVWQARFGVLTEELHDICAWCGLGYRVDLDAKGKKFIFRTLQGRDLAAAPGKLRTVTFALDMGNVSGVVYEEDESTLTNAVYALGAGQDEDQAVRLLYADEEGEPGPAATGLDRREGTQSVGNLRLPDEMDAEAYHQLKKSAKPVRSLTATVDAHGPFAYRKDWDLGDVATVRYRRPDGGAVALRAPIEEVTEVYERDGLSPRLQVTFGQAKPTLLEKLRRKLRG